GVGLGQTPPSCTDIPSRRSPRMPDGYPATKPYRHDRREGWGVSLGGLPRASRRSRPTWPAPGPVPVVDSSGSYRLLAIVKGRPAAVVATGVRWLGREP